MSKYLVIWFYPQMPSFLIRLARFLDLWSNAHSCPTACITACSGRTQGAWVRFPWRTPKKLENKKTLNCSQFGKDIAGWFGWLFESKISPACIGPNLRLRAEMSLMSPVPRSSPELGARTRADGCETARTAEESFLAKAAPAACDTPPNAPRRKGGSSYQSDGRHNITESLSKNKFNGKNQ